MPKTIEMTDLERQKLVGSGGGSIPCQNGWRPIETAPKDRLILVYIVRGKKKFSFYDVTRWIDWQDGDGYWAGVDGDERATHWHPLPKPPGEITN